MITEAVYCKTNKHLITVCVHTNLLIVSSQMISKTSSFVLDIGEILSTSNSYFYKLLMDDQFF